MTDITDFELRITSALERISKGVEAVSAAAAAAAAAAEAPREVVVDDAAMERLKDALEEEKAANAQLEARVRAIHDKQEGQIAKLEARGAKLAARAEAAETEIGRLRRINTALRENNTSLRAANAEGLGDAHLINKSMLAELDALRTLRDSDRGELDEIIEQLTPLATGEDTHA